MSWTDAHGTDAPLAYLITFRTYGTWLPGDARGTVDRLHNQPDTPMLPPNPQRERRAMEQVGSTIELDHEQRGLVERTIINTCKLHR